MVTTTCRTAMALGLLLTSLATCASADQAPLSRVRGIDGRAAALIDEGLWRSGTLQRMVDEVAASNVIVYVSRTALEGTLRGTLRFVGAGAGGGRYLLIELNDDPGAGLDAPTDRVVVIATLAHELQHALEVAAAADVQDLEAFEAFFGEIGTQRRPDVVDTDAAQLAGEQVYFEMTGRRR